MYESKSVALIQTDYLTDIFFARIDALFYVVFVSVDRISILIMLPF